MINSLDEVNLWESLNLENFKKVLGEPNGESGGVLAKKFDNCIIFFYFFILVAAPQDDLILIGDFCWLLSENKNLDNVQVIQL